MQAFVPLTSSFVRVRPAPSAPPASSSRPYVVITAVDKKPFFENPFTKKPDPSKNATGFAAAQPGDPGYVEPVAEKFEFEETGPVGPPSKIAAKKAAADATAAAEAEAAGAKGQKKSAFKKTALPVASGTAEVAKKKRGLDLLRQDFLRSAPEKIGVGRQDRSAVMAPSFGEPGYKPKAYETAYVSDLGISPFPDDANAVGKVGGLEAVAKAAREAKKGATASAIKAKVLKKAVVIPEEDIVYDIPSYLKPLPEDSPRKGLTWKNYNGR